MPKRKPTTPPARSVTVETLAHAAWMTLDAHHRALGLLHRAQAFTERLAKLGVTVTTFADWGNGATWTWHMRVDEHVVLRAHSSIVGVDWYAKNGKRSVIGAMRLNPVTHTLDRDDAFDATVREFAQLGAAESVEE